MTDITTCVQVQTDEEETRSLHTTIDESLVRNYSLHLCKLCGCICRYCYFVGIAAIPEASGAYV